MFRFKRFVVQDERCGMKVGTDGTLLGAWTPVEGVSDGRVLDIGTGSGLIALMLAQRCQGATILGIDSDENAASQAQENFDASPWANRLQARHIALQQFSQEPTIAHSFNLIVSNPPYFVDSLKNPDVSRRSARHTDSLSFEELLTGSARLLNEDGLLALIVPAEAEETILSLAAERQLQPIKITHVHTREDKPCKRVMLALTHKANKTYKVNKTDELVLQDKSDAPRSAAYQSLCKDFYL